MLSSVFPFQNNHSTDVSALKNLSAAWPRLPQSAFYEQNWYVYVNLSTLMCVLGFLAAVFSGRGLAVPLFPAWRLWCPHQRCCWCRRRLALVIWCGLALTVCHRLGALPAHAVMWGLSLEMTNVPLLVYLKSSVETLGLEVAESWEMAVAYSESRACKHHVLLVAVVGLQGQDAPPLLLSS